MSGPPDMPPNFDPYYEWLGIPPEEQPPHLYRLLGLSLFESHPAVIANAADRIMSDLKKHELGPHSADSQRLLNEVARAKKQLLNPATKRAYDETLQKTLQAPDFPAPVGRPNKKRKSKKLSPWVVGLSTSVTCTCVIVAFLLWASRPKEVPSPNPTPAPHPGPVDNPTRSPSDLGLPGVVRTESPTGQNAASHELPTASPEAEPTASDLAAAAPSELPPSEPQTSAEVADIDLPSETPNSLVVDLPKQPEVPSFPPDPPGKWTILFRSADPRIWDSAVNEGFDRFAKPLSEAPRGIQFLRMSVAGQLPVFLPMTDHCLRSVCSFGEYGWNPSNWDAYQGRHLGIFSEKDRCVGSQGIVSVWVTPAMYDFPGFGFGHRVRIDDHQGHSWNGVTTNPTVLEVAVTTSALAPHEKAQLLTRNPDHLDSCLPNDAQEYQGHYYRLFRSQATWHQARKMCELLGGHLIRIESDGENAFAQMLTDRANVWIDGSDEHEEGNWLYTNGERMIYQKWAPALPNNLHGLEHQPVLMANGMWEDVLGDSREMYLCEWDEMPGWLNLPPPAKKQNIPKALRDIRSFRKHRYRCFDGSYTRYVAEQYCERLGGHLVSIDDADEQVFVQRLLLSQPKPAEWYWIDGSDEGVEDVWRKGDGGKFDFANWANGQPQNIWLGEHGLVMHTRDMCRWHDAHSGMRLGFVCEWE